MKIIKQASQKPGALLLSIAMLLFLAANTKAQSKRDPSVVPANKFVHTGAGNPYLPLWEHLPDGEPRVFEDPDRPESTALISSDLMT